MEKMTIREVALAVGIPSRVEGEISSVCTDTRTIEPGCLFVALKGERFDGNDFVEQALAQGAAAALCERGGPGARLVVRDSGSALLQLAAYYCGKFSIPKIALTGSVGKTTTKEMTAAVLGQKYLTLKTEGNMNNQIGLPRTVFRMDTSTGAAVFEMGMDAAGQISRLSRTVKPDVGVLTNIGVSHIENLGSREGILRAKLEILDGMEPNAPLVLNGDDPYLAEAGRGLERPVIFYGLHSSACHVRAEQICQKEDGTEFLLCAGEKKLSAALPTIGEHNVYDALAAVAVGQLMGVPLEQAVCGLAEYVPAGMRQRVVRKHGLTVVEDCYNASPDSVRASLKALAMMPCEGKRIAVLGDMLELGSYAESAHRECGRAAADTGVDGLFTYGDNARYCAEEAGQLGVTARHYEKKEPLARELLELLQPGDVVLFKASRAIKLEEAMQMVYDGWEK